MGEVMELLAPAGDMDSFYAAVKNGADAVYLGGKKFSARSFANNFSIDEIRHVVRYAHIRGVKVYITVNTLISDDQFCDAIDFVSKLYMANVDGVIIQDLGLASVAKKSFLGLHLHASTQMTVYNKSGVEFLKRLGFKRVVIARETSLLEIQDIVKCGVDIEVFGHGALCISYSGQCLLSSMIGSRSGNRGSCAQPCRLRYELCNKDGVIACGHLISPKDLCSLDYISSFKESGISSIKIEGRMKTSEYVAIVTSIYRKYIDTVHDRVCKSDFIDIMQIFNRGGFTKGYFDGGAPYDMITTEKPKNWGTFLGEVVSCNASRRMVMVKLKSSIDMGDGIEILNGENKNPGVVVSQIYLGDKMVKSAKSGDVVWLGYLSGRIKKGDSVYKTSSKKLNQRARLSISGKDLKRVALSGSIIIRYGMNLKLSIRDKDGNKVEKVSDVPVCVAKKRPLTKDRVVDQIKKTGDTPYYFDEIDVDMSDDVVVPISEINNIRRSALKELDDIRGRIFVRYDVYDVLADEKYAKDDSRPNEVAVFFYKPDYDMRYWELGAGRIYLPLLITKDKRYKDILKRCRERGLSVYVHTPLVTRGRYDEYIKNNIDVFNEFSGVMCSNIGTIEYLRGRNIDILCDYTLNVYNTHSAKVLRDEGVSGVTLSCEMTLNEINAMKKIEGLTKEAIVYGSIPVMTMEYCVVGDLCGGYKDGCCDGACSRSSYYLKDRRGEKFAILCDKYTHKSTLFNANKIFWDKDIRKLSGVNSIRLNVLNESFDEVRDLVKLNYDILRGVVDEITIGKMKKKEKYTKGHLYRPV